MPDMDQNRRRCPRVGRRAEIRRNGYGLAASDQVQRLRCREAGLLLAAMGKQERRNRTLECTCKRHDRRLTIEQTVNSGQRRERRNAVRERCLKRKIPEITLRDFFVFAGIYPKLRDILFGIYR